MASLEGKVIAGWKLQEAIKCTPQLSIYKGILVIDFMYRQYIQMIMRNLNSV